jgi:hypothetical protein
VAAAVLAACASFPAEACDPSVTALITEIQASNDATLVDENGGYSDWIEIYNPCLPSVDLDGWYLTDDPSAPTKWRFPPSTVIERGTSIVVFASGKDRAVSGAELHTNFRLDVEGEYLALVEPDGSTVAHEFAPAFPPQLPNVSWGLPQAGVTAVGDGSAVRYRVPATEDAGLDWTAPSFDDAAWDAGELGIGMVGPETGFEVTFHAANVQVNDLSVAEAVLADPATQIQVVSAPTAFVNFRNTGAIGHFAGDLPFPGTTIGTDVNDFVVLVTASVLIPEPGPWTFGVNSDDGFGLELSREPHAFSSSFPGQRAAGDTFAVFDFPEAGSYDLRLVQFERGGGSSLELFAARGAHTSFGSGSFRLVGDVANGGLSVSGLGPFVSTDVTPSLLDTNASLWVRAEFELGANAFDLMRMPTRYEDCFVAWLNGQEIARHDAPPTLTWDAAATSDRPLDAALRPEPVDVTDAIGALVPGTNVLAVHVLNDDAADPHLLASPTLIAIEETSGTDLPRYFTTPTPGAVNGAGYPGVAPEPTFSHPSHVFTDAFDVTITTPSPAATIRYTLDGSKPDPGHGTIYSGPLAITTSTRLRAVVLEPGLAPGPVATRMYTRLHPGVLDFDSNLPVVVVDTFGSGLNTDWWTPVLGSVIPVDGTTGRAAITGTPDFVGVGALRMRGSSSLSFPKKQFFFETWDENQDDLDVSLLGMPPDSDWILYAPYSEKALMQNVLAYEWSNAIGRYAVRTRLCELFLQQGPGDLTLDDYHGVYVLMEKIKRHPSRVAIEELLPENGSPPAITGGYILKKDRLDPGDAGFFTSRGVLLAYVEPAEQEITAAQSEYLRGYINSFEAALYGPGFGDPETGYAAWIDVDSFIDHHILVELTKNIDGYRLSTFFHKDRGGKLAAGPIWDYNLSLGNANYLDGWIPTGWYHDLLDDASYFWWRRLFEDPEFRLRYQDRWFELRRGPFRTERLVRDVDDEAALLDEAQQRNFARWPILGVAVWPNWFVGETYESEVDWLRQFLTDRLEWIDAQFPAPPELAPAPGPVLVGTEITLTSAAPEILYTLDGSDPRLAGGAASPAAVVYAVPLVANADVHVRARSRDGETWSALAEGSFQAVPRAHVNEILPRNVVTVLDEAGEAAPWVELYNPSVGPMALDGLFLSDDPGDPAQWPIPAGTTLCGMGHLLVWADGEPNEGSYHASFVLDPAGGHVGLYDGAGSLVSELAYPALGDNVSFGRLPDGGSALVSFFHPTPGAENGQSTTAILVNEYNAVSPNGFLEEGAADSFFGRILGNGGDWFELVIVADHLDLRGYRVVVRDEAGTIDETTEILTFADHPLLADLRSGTILTVSESLPTDASYDPAGGDWWIHLRGGSGGNGTFVSALDFTVSNQQTQITILDPVGAIAFGPAGEGVRPASGVGNDEVCKLEDDPGPTVTAFSAYEDGTSSTFGAPNVWSSGAASQDFSALRSVVSQACTTDAECDDGDVCTDDACVADVCVTTPNTAPCDDHDECTTDDACSQRTCQGDPIPDCCRTDCDCGLEPNVCRTDSCELDRCLAEPSGACRVSGSVRYYRGGGAEPGNGPVPGVAIDVDGDGTSDAVSAADGSWIGPAVYGTLEASPLPWLDEPGLPPFGGAVTSFDAALVAQAAVELFQPSPNQRIAGDVSGNGELSAFDAAQVAQMAIGLLVHAEVATATSSDWRFLRCDRYEHALDHDCVEARYVHDPIDAPATDDFHAILYGDVSGNWHAQAQATGSAGPSGPRIAAARVGTSPEEHEAAARDASTAGRLKGIGLALRPVGAPPAVLRIVDPPGSLREGERRRVRIELERADGIQSLDLALRFDATILAVVESRAIGLADGWTAVRNRVGDAVRIGLYGPVPLTGSGPVLELTVEALRPLPRPIPWRIEAAANEGRIPLVRRELRDSAPRLAPRTHD